MLIYVVGLVISFIINNHLNPAHDQTEGRILARSIIVGIGWPVLAAVFLSLVLCIYACSICDNLTKLFGDFLDEVK